ncbi:unnamed protein product [Rotaria sordida]|uniref:Anoctamin n=1 Tax=Rotaria sordida TaxID=392033 RepID=A0A818UL01_9BILA|nr:unnamed protein product [Rotaria sordida]CAF3699875.1 unnamed protein product [Rotaria sordida]
MKRIASLPPLYQEYEMSTNNARITNDNVDTKTASLHRRSVLISSNPNSDSLPIDLILVYDHTNHHKDNDVESNHDNQVKKKKKPSERRRRFEEYLRKKQGLILSHAESNQKQVGFVKVHTPFDILLLAAENMRMRLPIEKIEENENDLPTSQKNQSAWYRFTESLKKPFRLDQSLKKDDPDYYTAIYSSDIDKFKYLFDKLRGSKDLYFTPTERSLLTHELLSRAHFDYDNDNPDDDQQYPVIIRPLTDPTAELQKVSERPGIDRLITKKAYECYFPLHESVRDDVKHVDDSELNDREKLKKHWATMRQCLKFQPLSLIRSYMGEKVAFYFALCGFYNQMLIPAALIGLIMFIYGISSVFSDRPTSDICGELGRTTYMCPRCDKTCPFWKLSDSCLYSKISYVFDNTTTVIFSILMSLWARWFMEFWKRRQAALQYDWDSIGFEEHLEPIRPAFENKAKKKGNKRINPVTGINEPYVSTRTRIPFFLVAAGVVLFMMAIVCVTVFGTIAYRSRMDYILKKTSVKTYSPIIITVTSAIMNLICSIILSQFYYWIARKLTDLELHKYQSTYDDSLIIKIYLFQFVNFYSSLFYIAFFKGRFFEYPSKYGDPDSANFTEQCDPAGCLVELSIQFFIIMIGKQIINNLLEFFNAMRRTLTRICFKRGEPEAQEQWEKDNQLIDFNSNTLIDEYLELGIYENISFDYVSTVIQFGFVTLFVAAFPLAPLFALLNNIIEIRLDAWKFLSKYKRPIPFKASDIGIWSDIISAISYIAVLTNAVVIAWTSEFIPKMAYRSIQSTGGSLSGYVNWTLSSFSIVDYNLTDTVPEKIPDNLTICRYRDFREPTGPSYSQTSIYWNVLAARLAFIIVFEHVIFFIIYLMQWLVPDVPKKIQNNIDHERYIDQRERWASKTTEAHFKDAITASEALSKIIRPSSGTVKTLVNEDYVSSKHSRGRNRRVEAQLSLDNE